MHMTHDEFISEAEDKLTKATVDEIAKVSGYIHSVLVLSAMRRITFSEKVQANMRRVIAKQSMEMGLALYKGGQWSQQEAVEVAKCWIELFHNTSSSAYLIADTDTQKTDALLEHAHEKSSNLISGKCFAETAQAEKVAKACDWLRENHTDVTGKRPPSNAPDGIHAGIELLKRLLHGEPDADKQSELKDALPKGRQPVTEQEAADICDCTSRTIRNWEVGIHTPKNPAWPGLHSVTAIKAFAVTRKSDRQSKQAIRNMTHGDMDKLPNRSVRR